MLYSLLPRCISLVLILLSKLVENRKKILGGSHVFCMVLRLPFRTLLRVLDSDSPNWYCHFFPLRSSKVPLRWVTLECFLSHVFPRCNASLYNSVKGITFSSVTEPYHSNKDMLLPSSRNLGKNYGVVCGWWSAEAIAFTLQWNYSLLGVPFKVFFSIELVNLPQS